MMIGDIYIIKIISCVHNTVNDMLVGDINSGLSHFDNNLLNTRF